MDFGGCEMDNTTNYDLEEWLDNSSTEEKIRQNRQGKKRRRPPRKNRKPSRPANYIGQRTNNHLLRIFLDR